MALLQQTADTAAYEGARCAMVPGASAEEAIAEAQSLLKKARLVETVVTVDPGEIRESSGSISVHVSIPFAKNCWFFKSLGESWNITSDVTLLTERTPMVQLTGIPELQKKAKGGGGKVNL